MQRASGDGCLVELAPRGSPAQLPQGFKPTCLSRPHRASGNLHAPWASELHLLPPAHLHLSHSSFSPLRLRSGCPSPPAPPPTILWDPAFVSFPYSLPETRCPAAPILNASFLSGVFLAQSQPRILGAEASPVSPSPPHHSQSCLSQLSPGLRTICSFDFTWFLGCNLCSTLTQWAHIHPLCSLTTPAGNGHLSLQAISTAEGPGHCSVAGDLQVSFKLQLTCHLL